MDGFSNTVHPRSVPSTPGTPPWLHVVPASLTGKPPRSRALVAYELTYSIPARVAAADHAVPVVAIFDEIGAMVLFAAAGTGIELIAMTPRSTSVRRSSPGHGRQPVQRRCTSRPSVTGIYRSGEWTTSSPPHATCRRRWRRSRRTHGRVDACVHGQLPRRARHLLHAGGNNDEVDPTAPRSIGHTRVPDWTVAQSASCS